MTESDCAAGLGLLSSPNGFRWPEQECNDGIGAVGGTVESGETGEGQEFTRELWAAAADERDAGDESDDGLTSKKPAREQDGKAKGGGVDAERRCEKKRSGK